MPNRTNQEGETIPSPASGWPRHSGLKQNRNAPAASSTASTGESRRLETESGFARRCRANAPTSRTDITQYYRRRSSLARVFGTFATHSAGLHPIRRCVRSLAKADLRALMETFKFDPHVWSRRAVQEGFVNSG
jgi:hypothetical protein